MFKRVIGTSVKILLFAIGAILLLFCVLFFAAGSERTQLKTNENLVFAHRGQATKAAENSFEAIELAIADGYTAIELDIRMSQDGKPMLFHDDSLTRLCKTKGSIEQMPFQQLQTIHLYFDDKKTDNTIADLETVFKKHPDLIYYLDVKEPTSKNLSTIADLIDKYSMQQNTIVAHADFVSHLLHRIKFPHIISCNEGFNSGKEWILKVLPRNLQTDYYAGFMEKTDKKQMDKLRDWGLANKKIAYSVNESNIEKAVNEYGLHHIIVDLKEPQNYFQDSIK